jgi:poly-gamma-glutamate capsule biosynthesis protein CapA/YwtB (metallophosphatase superfamily)
MTENASFSFLTGGDIAPVEIPAKGMLGDLRRLFREADFSFLNVEHPLSNKGVPVRGKKFLHRGSSEHVEGFVEAGVGAVNLANNHILDFGESGLMDTIAQFEAKRIPVFGAGENLPRAAAPLVLQKGGLRVGFLGYTCNLPLGFAATPTMAGVNPLRVRTAYRTPHNLDELPGTAPIIETWPAAEDLQAMALQVRSLKENADLAIVYIHWGTSMIGPVHDHQSTIGHAAIEAGADAVFGGHQHVVSAIEFFREKPIVHCTGDLIFDVVEPWFDDSTTRNILFGATLTRTGLRDCYALACTTGIGAPPTLASSSSEVGQAVYRDLKLFSEPYGTEVRVSGDRFLLAPGGGPIVAPRFGAALHRMGLPSAVLQEAVPAVKETVRSSGEMFAAKSESDASH